MEGWGTGEADDDSEKICKDLKCRWCQIDILTSTQAAERKAHLAGAITVINYLSANVYTIVKCKLKPMYKLTESLINACFSILNMLGCRRVLTCQHPTRSVNIPSSSPVINQFSPVMEKWSKKWTATWCIVSKRESLDRGRNFWFTSLFTFQLSPVVMRFAEPPRFTLYYTSRDWENSLVKFADDTIINHIINSGDSSYWLEINYLSKF